ncbi:ribosomal protein S18-alanine N-acetyltransferase [Methanothermobacter wolfeii]|uniref:Ribosomal protein S18-alanine N-acetyltransferase n=1 Tax=Methanothermobacter wolfeii TaxID=145261 RepID=A0A9E7UMR9_METWO|nr:MULTISPECIES: ribosomal protein S18-alanine N-acetyltransferase [Methanothermobacter]MDI6701976.1 ribosomal protein S18-alanine N-acetyltransferase [Methanothermobacter wolfeii]NLM02751.1 ribosomal protein S18-alanine N-acetyltransferase [Methanothermobacter wolfeii]QHN06740.1 ribosomal-protein-alanine N-acetyltransferase [Methanothermobacter sp. THM-1]UXH31282.1 ribosomal protein S18-alanine N-acetyltransferase [Methanothermobacter wolfeii]SCM58005.1 putative N-acetyltransferase MJ1530 [Me
MIIREFKPQDLKRVLEIEKASFRDPYPANLLRDIYNLGAGFLVAQEDGKVVGFIIFWIRFEDEGHIISLAVDKDYRRRGVGRELVRMTISIFEKFHIKNIKLEVRAENRVAISFYRSLGFREEKIIRDYYEDGEDAVVMTMDISEPGVKRRSAGADQLRSSLNQEES